MTGYEAYHYTFPTNKQVPWRCPLHHGQHLLALSCQFQGQWSCRSSSPVHSHRKVASHNYRRNRCKQLRSWQLMSGRTGHFHHHLLTFLQWLQQCFSCFTGCCKIADVFQLYRIHPTTVFHIDEVDDIESTAFWRKSCFFVYPIMVI